MLCSSISCLFSFRSVCFLFFFFTHPPTPDIYTLSLHDALPICFHQRTPICFRDGGAHGASRNIGPQLRGAARIVCAREAAGQYLDRKSTRLNSSHVEISYAVFCLKKKKKREQTVRNHDDPLEKK